ncbi:MAG: TIM-barrel domain-containing protein [Archangium sp.]
MRFPLLAVCLTLFACPEPKPTPDAGTPSGPYTPRWAFEPWISKDISTRDDSYAFVDGFRSRDIPVGVLVLDSPWETNYNTFIPNPSRYPEFEKMVKDMRGNGVRIVLWTTQMVNESSFDVEAGGDNYVGPASNFGVGLRNGYYVNDGAIELWWKGQGAAVDFFNPDAVKWWREQQNALLDMGVAGWKLDFGESYILTVPIKTFAGEKTLQEYSEAYYRDFYEHGIERVGREEFVTMVRPYDKSYVFDGRFFARPEHAPVAWVGDNRRDWVGLDDALDHIFRSAKANYVMLGSDLGGYLDLDDVDLTLRVPFDRVNFLRWTALSAMTPFMQLHGRGNLTPWTLPGDTDVNASVAIYRYWSKLHHELVPFFFSTAQEAYAGNKPVPMQPIGELADWPGDYRYVLGESFLVAPILDGSGVRDVVLPAGSRWVDWWTNSVHEGGTTLSAYDSTDLKHIPLFVKEGAVIPLDVTDDVTGLGSTSSSGRVTVLAYPSTSRTTFINHEEDGQTTELSTSRDASSFTVAASRAPKGLVIRVFTDDAVITSVGSLTEQSTRAAFDAADSGWFRDGKFTWVRVAATPDAVSISLVR